MLRRMCGIALVLLLTQQWMPALVCGMHCSLASAGAMSMPTPAAAGTSPMAGMNMEEGATAALKSAHRSPASSVCAQPATSCCDLNAAFLSGKKLAQDSLLPTVNRPVLVRFAAEHAPTSAQLLRLTASSRSAPAGTALSPPVALRL